jgi:hypothetical protein
MVAKVKRRHLGTGLDNPKDIDEDHNAIEILAVGLKDGNRLIVGGETLSL